MKSPFGVRASYPAPSFVNPCLSWPDADGRPTSRCCAEPDYRRLFLGRTTSLIGDGMAPVALAFAILDLTGSATDLGIVLAAHSLVLIALLLVGGVFADRISPRLAMLGADLARMVSMGLIAVLLLTGTAEIWQLAAALRRRRRRHRLLQPGLERDRPADRPRRPPAGGKRAAQLLALGGKVAGPALAGVLLALGSPGSALAVDAATFAVSAACLWAYGRRAAPGG